MDHVAASKHLKYEIDMFIHTARLIESKRISGGIGDAVLESWVLHLRNLIDFFYTEKKQDDIVIADFMEGDEWKGHFPEYTSELRRAKSRANKEMAHLSLSRVGIQTEDRQWAVGALTNALLDRAKAFVESVDEKKVVDDLGEFLEDEGIGKLAISAVYHTSRSSNVAFINESSWRTLDE